MVQIGNIEKQKKADKRTGLLALAADTSETTARQCLSSEEMTKLLEEKCGTSSRQELLTHLAHCPKCYEEWSLLRGQLLNDKESGQHKKRGKLLQFISRPKNMAIWGSALTAVASVLFVLNTQIHKQPMLYHEELAVTQEPAGIGNEREQRSTAPDAMIEPEQVVQQPAPFVDPKQTAQPESVPRREDLQQLAEKSMAISRQKEHSLETAQQAKKQRAASRPTVQEKKKKDVMVEVEASRAPKEETMLSADSLSLQDQAVTGSYSTSDKIATPRGTAKKAAPAKNTTLTVSGWIEQVEKACLSGHYDEPFWKQLLASGKMLKEQYQNKRLSDEQFIKVFDCVKRMDEQEYEKLCSQIQKKTNKN